MEYKSSYNEIYTEDTMGKHIGYIKFENIGFNTYCITETHVDFILVRNSYLEKSFHHARYSRLIAARATPLSGC